jgi:predicted transcriptional regulator
MFDHREFRGWVSKERGHGGLARLAREVGVSADWIARISTGRVSPSDALRARIFAALGPEAERAITRRRDE